MTTEDPQYIPGQILTGGPFPRRRNGTGVLTSIDVSSGKVRWRHHLPYPAQGGALITSTGLDQCAVSLLARGEAPASDGFERAMDGYAAAIGLVRKEGLTRGLPSDMVERVFAISIRA